ncbi:MAG: phenylalanine--tRNA ligase subunit alpha [Actinobacteria bacterium]|nr:phenylalanine--tRNA ligase subunit alpha [Actinomycetota bacterium]MBV8960063.1 phenylalanine--tRNA ligase subunit alpha [Actinomycetota bacterium]MBV9663554.1 phenylalanine--tRNA ligase subunit alpha [Actinomycetota bacterium]
MSTDLDIARVEADATQALSDASSLVDLDEATTRVLGKKSALNQISQRLGSLDPDARKEAGQALNAARSRVQSVAASRRDELEAAARAEQLAGERLDLTETMGRLPRGRLNVVTQTWERLEDVFVAMGYIVAEGPEVESDWYNFTALNLPVAHPARSAQDSAYLDLGEPESVLLRTQTSPVQIRLMEAQKPPIYAIMPGRVYRRDTPDARHNPTFTQIEGLVVDRGITFGDLAGTIEAFTNAYFGARMHSRLRPYYFPFTEPSAELEVTCVICEGAGCRTCSNTGWIELGGCGMVHPNVFRNVGLDPEEWSGFAFGFGIDRLAQVRHGIADMRVLFQNDVRFIEQF